MRRRSFVIAVSAGIVGFGVLRPAVAGTKWRLIYDKKGVRVSTRMEGDRQFPTFRAVTIIDAPLVELMAIIGDADRHDVWIKTCNDSRLLKRINEHTFLMYNSTALPWPADDRDVIMRGTMDMISATEVKFRFRSVNSKLVPKVNKRVRIPLLEGYWWLRGLPDGSTHVQYQVNSDPGGRLPEGVVTRGSKDLPLGAIFGLRDHVVNTMAAGTYADVVAAYEARLQVAGS